MDLELDENQRAIADLALQILRESLTRERLRAIEATDDRVGTDEWNRLADAGLLGVPLTEDVGGSGLGIVEACLVLEQIGRTVAPLPYLATVVGSAMPVDDFGSPAQRERILPLVCDGSLLLANQIGSGHSMLLGYTMMVASFLLIYFGIRSYRDNVLGGQITFGRAFAWRFSAATFVVALVCAGLVGGWLL